MGTVEKNFQGEAEYKNIPANEPAKGAQLGPGNWVLHPRSTVPFVRILIGAIGTRSLSWGEVFSIPDDTKGQVENNSFHAGDIIMAKVGCCQAPQRPARITIAAPIVFTGPGQDAPAQSPWVDTRLARRAYLAVEGIGADFAYQVLNQAPTKGLGVPPGSSAQSSGGIVSTQRTVVGPIQIFPLGIASGDYIDPAGNTYPEMRPMALLDRARILVDRTTAVNKGFIPGANAFYILEY